MEILLKIPEELIQVFIDGCLEAGVDEERLRLGVLYLKESGSVKALLNHQKNYEYCPECGSYGGDAHERLCNVAQAGRNLGYYTPEEEVEIAHFEALTEDSWRSRQTLYREYAFTRRRDYAVSAEPLLPGIIRRFGELTPYPVRLPDSVAGRIQTLTELATEGLISADVATRLTYPAPDQLFVNRSDYEQLTHIYGDNNEQPRTVPPVANSEAEHDAGERGRDDPTTD